LSSAAPDRAAPQFGCEIALRFQQEIDRKVARIADHPDRLGGILDRHHDHRWLERRLREPIGRHPMVLAVVRDGDDVQTIGEVAENRFLGGFVHD